MTGPGAVRVYTVLRAEHKGRGRSRPGVHHRIGSGDSDGDSGKQHTGRIVLRQWPTEELRFGTDGALQRDGDQYRKCDLGGGESEHGRTGDPLCAQGRRVWSLGCGVGQGRVGDASTLPAHQQRAARRLHPHRCHRHRPQDPGAHVLETQLVQVGIAWFPQFTDSPVSVT